MAKAIMREIATPQIGFPRRINKPTGPRTAPTVLAGQIKNLRGWSR
jgi:hypothetical protein